MVKLLKKKNSNKNKYIPNITLNFVMRIIVPAILDIPQPRFGPKNPDSI